MPRRSAIKVALEQAAKAAQQQVLADTLGGLAAKTSVGALIDEFNGTAFSDAFRAMSLSELVTAVGGAAPKGKRRGRPPGSKAKAGAKKGAARGPKKYNTRTQAGRQLIDAAMTGFLSKHGGPARAEDIRRAIGGNPPQIRESLSRLMSAKKVSKKGQKRSTSYNWKG